MALREERSRMGRVLRTGASFALVAGTRVIAAAGLLVFNFAISNRAGVNELGRMSALLSVLVGGAVIGRLGFDLLAMRLVGAVGPAGRNVAAGYVWAGVGAVLLASSLVTALLWASSSVLAVRLGVDAVELRATAVATPFLASAGVVGACLRASGANALGNLFDVGGLALLAGGLAFIDAFTAFAGVSNVLTGASLLLGSAALIAMARQFPAPAASQLFESAKAMRKHLGELASLYVLTVVQYVAQWMSIIASAHMLSPHETAGIAVAQRYSMMLFLLLSTVAGVMGPKYAALYEAGDIAGVRLREKRIRGGLVIVAMPVLLAFLALPSLFMGMFGIHDRGSEFALQVLAVAQLINLFCGCAPHILIVAGRARELLAAALIGSALALGLMYAATATYGLRGLAVGNFAFIVLPALIALHIASRKVLNASSVTKAAACIPG